MKNVHQVCDAGIQTHDLHNVSLITHLPTLLQYNHHQAAGHDDRRRRRRYKIFSHLCDRLHSAKINEPSLRRRCWPGKAI